MNINNVIFQLNSIKKKLKWLSLYLILLKHWSFSVSTKCSYHADADDQTHRVS